MGNGIVCPDSLRISRQAEGEETLKGKIVFPTRWRS
jgi:hypothetical protein